MYKIQPNAAYGENVEMGGILSIQIVGYYSMDIEIICLKTIA